MVNAIPVGACDTTSVDWQRAPYSSHGPGRSPGLIKPDGVAFGGSDAQPFIVYNALTNQYAHTSGTSFSSPALLRTGIRSEEHTSELQSLMRISYAVFCLKKKTTKKIKDKKKESRNT